MEIIWEPIERSSNKEVMGYIAKTNTNLMLGTILLNDNYTWTGSSRFSETEKHTTFTSDYLDNVKLFIVDNFNSWCEKHNLIKDPKIIGYMSNTGVNSVSSHGNSTVYEEEDSKRNIPVFIQK
ncbi:hypothetical protein [Proteus vulgaris]|uniref:hypothetical protein n=1 Tax=Proteus vulgaris TaxID=585 RepID=UPI0013D6084A|nr:hypothetical protein [Proteus vulgaris]